MGPRIIYTLLDHTTDILLKDDGNAFLSLSPFGVSISLPLSLSLSVAVSFDLSIDSTWDACHHSLAFAAAFV